MTMGSPKQNSKIPALSGGQKPRQDIRVVMSIVEEELPSEASPQTNEP